MKQRIIDLSYLKTIAGDDDVFIQEMLQMFLNTTPPELENIEKFHAGGDLHMMGSSAHKIKAPIQMLGDETTTNLLIRIEQIAKSGEEKEQLPALVAEIKERLALLIEEVREMVDQEG